MLLKRLSPNRRNNEGSALVAVLGIMAVTAIIGVTVTTAAIHGLETTSSTRASVQARAAAEAGIDVAVAGLQTTDSCVDSVGVYESSAAPRYRAEIHYDDSGTWKPGCPPPTATRVRIESTGFAEAKGVGSSSGDTRVMEAVYNYIPDYVEIPHIDAAVYAHSMSGDLKSFNLDSVENSLAADLQIKNGDANCINGARIAGDVILGNGSATLKNCDVTGSIHVSKSVFMDLSSDVFGDVIAVGQGVTGSANVVAVEGGSITKGDIYSGGSVSITGNGSTAEHNVTVAGTSASDLSIASQSHVLGSSISSGTVTDERAIKGAASTAVVGLQPPPVPQIPTWTDVSYPSPKWAAEGFAEVMWTGDCSVGGTHTMWASLSTFTTPTVVNALSCGAAGLTTLANVHDLSFKTNIAIVAHKFTINKLYAASNDATTIRNLWFVVPDNTANSAPTCSSPAGDIYMHSAANIDLSIAAMVYTPCIVHSDRDGWRGQIYGGEVKFGAQAKLTFVPVGIPGVDFSGGVPPTMVLDGGHLGNKVSVRELASSG